MKQVSLNVRQAVLKIVENLLEEHKELDIFKVAYILEDKYGIRFYNLGVLQELIMKALDEIVFIYV
ncbi:hypothetical protein [Clostridium septicum]|uniref:Uncharacterized protein n=1 Tax=Clostridium septicum TaxID=1504 RepID=A0A9N7JM66_CLOSE|nr:hypothetical protein [Clostridium septicum]AYE35278.1 hypothetical protein CP523_13065 [Clostridium septicum]MDU1313904.1 hypothetical protein [Clostridium septicum]QAS60672.1 hypothetical protein EI377_07935 [Clostridium septicum]UEC20071.1 hypothetical protein LK444_11730 [Clostridium septicum]USS01873.1 hypothetical protein NH397_05440 [Clostridium septicum]